MGERRRAVTEGTSLGTSSQMSWSSWVDGVAIYKNQAHEGRACQQSGGRSQSKTVLGHSSTELNIWNPVQNWIYEIQMFNVTTTSQYIFIFKTLFRWQIQWFMLIHSIDSIPCFQDASLSTEDSLRLLCVEEITLDSKSTLRSQILALPMLCDLQCLPTLIFCKM